jgi:hypothetical protein
VTDGPEVCAFGRPSLFGSLLPRNIILNALFAASNDVEEAARLVAAASPEELASSIRALEKVEPAGPTIGEDEFSTLSAIHNIQTGLLEATAELARFLALAPNRIEPEQINDRLAQQLEIPLSDRDKFKATLAQLKQLGDRILEKFNSYGQLAAVMPSFVGCDVACDIRLVSETSESSTNYVPVAIIRIKLDEGHDAIFQCNIHAIAKLQRAMQAATVTLKQLNDTLAASLRGNNADRAQGKVD